MLLLCIREKNLRARASMKRIRVLSKKIMLVMLGYNNKFNHSSDSYYDNSNRNKNE